MANVFAYDDNLLAKIILLTSNAHNDLVGLRNSTNSTAEGYINAVKSAAGNAMQVRLDNWLVRFGQVLQQLDGLNSQAQAYLQMNKQIEAAAEKH